MDEYTEILSGESEIVSVKDAFSAFGMDVPEAYRSEPADGGAASGAADGADGDGENDSGTDAGNNGGADDSGVPDDENDSGGQTHELREAHKAARIAGRDDLHEEINRQFSQIRAEAERQTREQMDALVASLGLADTVTGEPIRSREQLEASRRAAEAAALTARLSSGELSADDLSKVVADAVSQHPDVIAARAVAQEAEAQRAAQIRTQIDAEIAQIGQYDTAVKTVRDLTALDRYAQIHSLIERGATALEAYETIYRDKVESVRVAKLVDAELKKRGGKNHLKPADIGGSGAGADADVTLEQIKAFRKFPQFRDKSSEEIRKIIANTKIVTS